MGLLWINVDAHVIARKPVQFGVYLVAPLAEAWGNYPRNAANGGEQRRLSRGINLVVAVE